MCTTPTTAWTVWDAHWVSLVQKARCVCFSGVVHHLHPLGHGAGKRVVFKKIMERFGSDCKYTAIGDTVSKEIKAAESVCVLLSVHVHRMWNKHAYGAAAWDADSADHRPGQPQAAGRANQQWHNVAAAWHAIPLHQLSCSLIFYNR